MLGTVVGLDTVGTLGGARVGIVILIDWDGMLMLGTVDGLDTVGGVTAGRVVLIDWEGTLILGTVVGLESVGTLGDATVGTVVLIDWDVTPTLGNREVAVESVAREVLTEGVVMGLCVEGSSGGPDIKAVDGAAGLVNGWERVAESCPFEAVPDTLTGPTIRDPLPP